ncbi:MAG: ankyrin repeat domain-containing protein [Castellaniella sp.]|uniref:ankyrin repeat domain-containing protein n=1 Tax=Castellaniella sp. TaxID=1955812 RepID=UPI003A851EB1
MSLLTHVRSRARLAGLALLLAVGAGLSPAVSAQQAPTAPQAPTADWWSAIRRDDVSTVQDMLLRYTDPNARNDLGNPALIQAAREQSWRVFDTLRASPDVKIDEPNAQDETALMYLCILGETDRARALIATGAQVNRLGWTPLHYAASKARVDTARMLIERGAIVNAPGPDGTTPLMMAALSGKPDIVRLLLSHGADPTMINAARETAADWARKRNHVALAASLEHAAVRVAQKRQGAPATEATPQTPRPETQGASLVDAAPPVAPAPESGAEDRSSFSRYFDPGRFEDTPQGQ